MVLYRQLNPKNVIPHVSRFYRGRRPFLLIEGIWGLSSPVVFGVLPTNTLHAVIHLILGVLALVSANRGPAPGYLLFLGLLLLVVGVLWFVPGGRTFTDWFAINRPVAILNLVIGSLSLLLATRGK